MDTNVVSEVSKKRPSGKVLNFIQANETQCVVPAIVVAERYHGANGAPPDQRADLLQAVHDFRNEFADRILPFDAEAAETWGEYASRSALTHGLIVVTCNIDDFPEVNTLNPFED